MKRFCILLSILLPGLLRAADIALPAMTNATTVASSDLLYVVKSPGGTPTDNKITIGNLSLYLTPTWANIAGKPTDLAGYGITDAVALTTGSLAQFATTTSSALRGVLSDESGTGALLFAGGNLGAATATSINGLTITTSTGTVTIANSKTLTASNTLTFTGTDGSTVAYGAGGTAAFTANKLSVFAATTSAELAGVLSDESGSGGGFVRATGAALVTPTIGGGTALAKVLSSSDTIDFGEIAAGDRATLTVTVTGAGGSSYAGVVLGWEGALEAGLVVAQAWVSGSDTVSVTVANVSASPIDPAALACRATVIQF